MSSQRLAAIIKYGLYVLALMPLVIFSQFLSPFHFGKIVIFRPAVEILGILYVILLLKDRRWWIKTDKIFWSITVFTAVFLLTALTGFDRYASFMGTLERMGGWFSFLHFWLFFILLRAVLRQREDWMTLIKISVVVSLISTLYGFLQKTSLGFIVGAGGRSRIFGTIGNPALFAGYELLNIFLALGLILRQTASRHAKIFFTLILLFNLLAVFISAVRGSLLATVLSFAFFAFLLSRFWGGPAVKFRRAIFWILAIMLAGELVLVFNQKADWVKNDRYLSRLADVSLDSPTVRTRFWAWQAGLNGWNDSGRTIFLGWGPENFNLPFSKHFNPRFYSGPGSETLFDRGHNMFVEVLVTMGLIGLFSYLAIFVALGSALWRLYRSKLAEFAKTGAIFSAGLAAYLIHNFFIFDTSANFLLFFILAGFISWSAQEHEWSGKNPLPINHQAAAVNLSHASKTVSAPRSALANFLGFLLIFPVALSIYLTSVIPTKANYASTRAIVAFWDSDYQRGVDKFLEALSYQTFGSYEIRHRYIQYLLENFSKFKDPQQREELLLMAVAEVKKNITPHDKDYLPYLYISRAYIMLGQNKPDSPYNQLALQNSSRAQEIAPTFVRTYFEIAQAYLNQKDYPRAIAAFKQAIELNPRVSIAYWYLGATELEKGDLEHGWAMIQEAERRGYNFSEGDYGRVLRVHIERKDLAGITWAYERLISENPNNPQYFASLASTYQQLGRIDEAEQAARQAAQIDPSFEKEARLFIESLLGRRY